MGRVSNSDMQLYNTLSRRVEDFEPIAPPAVGMYVCGPTVYDYAHIGHMRKYVGDDLLRRTLEYLGFEVKMVMNITDVEDKIIKNSFRDMASKGIIKVLTKKPSTPSKEEIISNPRSRSAKLRAAEVI